MGVCYMFGDPHFYTFDGGVTVLNHRTNPRAPLNFWIVYSKELLIQGMAEKTGGLKGLAIGGETVKNHTIIYTGAGMTVDGSPILSEPGEYSGFDGLFEIFRHSTMVWPGDSLKDLDASGKWFQALKQFYGKEARGSSNYHIKLPYGQQIFVSGSKFLQAVIKARPGQYQGGYCGDFNGHVEDDTKPTNARFWLNAQFAAGTKLDALSADEDMFQKAGVLLQSDVNNSLQSDVNNSKKEECPEDLKAKAEELCGSMPEQAIHDACIIDICFTGDTSYADDAMNMELMNVEFAKGSVELQGQGNCLDSEGAKYTTVTAKDVSTKTECLKTLHELAHEGMVDKGVRGAQFKDSCDIIIDAKEKDDVELEESIPYTLGGVKKDAGSGIVSKTDKVEGVTCWKIMI